MNGDQEEVRYAVKVISREVRNLDGVVITSDGVEFWVANDEYGPSGYRFDNQMPHNVLTFKTKDEARAFASEWGGAPWWVKPRDWRIIEVVPRYIRQGWRVK